VKKLSSKKEGHLHSKQGGVSKRELNKESSTQIEKISKYLMKLKPDEDTCEMVAFLANLFTLLNCIATIVYFIKVGVPLGGRIRLLQPRNTFIRPDKPFLAKFEYIYNEKTQDGNFDYKVSLKGKEGTLWGPIKKIERIKFESDKSDGGSARHIENVQIDYENFKPDIEYKWIIEIRDRIKSASFKVIDKKDLEIIKYLERQIEQADELKANEKYLLLGMIYEQMNLLDEALDKYKLVLKADSTISIALLRISAIYTKKASRYFDRDIDFENLSDCDIDKDDADLAIEANSWSRRWNDDSN
jgi:tetratricopeptide (TPR) repeat protein